MTTTTVAVGGSTTRPTDHGGTSSTLAAPSTAFGTLATIRKDPGYSVEVDGSGWYVGPAELVLADGQAFRIGEGTLVSPLCDEFADPPTGSAQERCVVLALVAQDGMAIALETPERVRERRYRVGSRGLSEVTADSITTSEGFNLRLSNELELASCPEGDLTSLIGSSRLLHLIVDGTSGVVVTILCSGEA